MQLTTYCISDTTKVESTSFLALPKIAKLYKT